jgi:hypothetical protein
VAGKLSKSDVGYSLGQPHCGLCTHFREDKESEKGTCELVAGTIDEDYWCKLYKQKHKPTIAEGGGS